MIEKAERDGGVRSNQFYIQSVTKYLTLTLVFTLIAHYGKSLISTFQEIFASIDKIFILAAAHCGIILWSLDTFLIFPKLLRF